MATGTKTNVTIYDEEFFSGIVEVVEQYAEDIATGTNGAINYVTESLKGDFEKRSFWNVTDLISDRDPTSTADVTGTAMSQGELVAPKSNMRIGPVEQTEDAFYKIADDPSVMSLILGQQMGPAIAVDWLNRGLAAATAALTKSTDTHLDVSTATTPTADDVITPRLLNRAMGLLGDKRSRIVALVMHSNAYTQLTEDYIVNKIDGVTDQVIYGGSSPTLGVNTLISDSPALIDEVNGHLTILGLTEDAVRLIESEDRRIMVDRVSGKENLVVRLQGELANNTRIKGYSWSGATSPDTAALGTGASWTSVFDSPKSGPGIALTVNSKY